LAAAGNQHVAGNMSNCGLQVNLPKLQFLSFDGDLQQWQEYWDVFDASVHQQENLPPATKFNYLTSTLKGPAAMAISGIPANNDNYKVALKLLKEKFGRPEKIVTQSAKRGLIAFLIAHVW